MEGESSLEWQDPKMALIKFVANVSWLGLATQD